MTNEELADALRAFGLGTQTTIDWPYQPAGSCSIPSQYYATGKYSTAIGYGVAVTGMQMLDAFATIANGGVTRPPHLLDATIDAKGVRHPARLEPGRRVVSREHADQMTQMLAGSRRATGPARARRFPGTRSRARPVPRTRPCGGTYTDGTMASFIGYAPAEHPKLATIVVLDEPTNSYGGKVAAPVFSEIMQFALTQYGVTPDDVGNGQFDAAQRHGGRVGHHVHRSRRGGRRGGPPRVGTASADDRRTEPKAKSKPSHRGPQAWRAGHAR